MQQHNMHNDGKTWKPNKVIARVQYSTCTELVILLGRSHVRALTRLPVYALLLFPQARNYLHCLNKYCYF